MLNKEMLCSIDCAISDPDVKDRLQDSWSVEEIHQILEDLGIYVYLRDFFRVCAYIRIRLAEQPD